MTPTRKQPPDALDRPARDEDTYYVYRREEDRSFWIKASWFIEKYRILFLLAGAVLIAFGFGFKTPKAQFDDLKSQQALLQQQINGQKEELIKSRQERIELQGLLETIVRLQCMDHSPYEIALMPEVDCKGYSNQTPRGKK
jgi:hypothetical protein